MALLISASSNSSIGAFWGWNCAGVVWSDKLVILICGAA
jgi:hypothetical protein